MSKITDEHIIRYYTSWFHKFSDDERAKFKKYKDDYKKATAEERKKFKDKKRNEMLEKGKDFE